VRAHRVRDKSIAALGTYNLENNDGFFTNMTRFLANQIRVLELDQKHEASRLFGVRTVIRRMR
jgi:hypothetical protein